MGRISLNLTDNITASRQKALRANIALAVVLALVGVAAVSLGQPGLLSVSLAVLAWAMLGLLLAGRVDPFGYLRCARLKKRALRRIVIEEDRLLLTLADGSTQSFNRDSCCEKFSFEPDSHLHGYYLDILQAKAGETRFYIGCRVSERDALRQALRGNCADAESLPCGERRVCGKCGSNPAASPA